MTNGEFFSECELLRSASLLLLTVCFGIHLTACGDKSATPSAAPTTSPTAASSAQRPGTVSGDELEVADADAAPASHKLYLPLTGHWTGDFDALVKHKVIRALVVNGKVEFFYDKGRPRGTVVEALQELEIAVNKRLGNPNPRVKIAYLPTPLSQLKPSLENGVGDIIATGIVISAPREEVFDLSRYGPTV